MRVLTARVIEQMLSTWHIAAISSYDIIVLENGIAHVDLPCSGLRSLWTGTLFLLATTWLEGRQLGTRWFVVCGTNLFLLISANIVRVLVLVVTTYVLQQRAYAQVLHLPLGLLGFICASALTWLLLQTVPKHKDFGLCSTSQEQKIFEDNKQRDRPISKEPKTLKPDEQSNNPKSKIQDSKLIQVLLPVFVITLAQIAQISQSPEKLISIASLQLPPTIVQEFIPLTAAEQRLFQNTSTALAKNTASHQANFLVRCCWCPAHPGLPTIRQSYVLWEMVSRWTASKEYG